jgi:hypothetical protein
MMRTLTAVICLVGVAMASVSASAATTTKPRRHKPIREVRFVDPQPPLTVNRRSWLDPGPVVPVGTMNNYMNANTFYNRTPDQNFARSKFGNEALPRPLEVPGRPVPIYEFETPRVP